MGRPWSRTCGRPSHKSLVGRGVALIVDITLGGTRAPTEASAHVRTVAVSGISAAAIAASVSLPTSITGAGSVTLAMTAAHACACSLAGRAAHGFA